MDHVFVATRILDVDNTSSTKPVHSIYSFSPVKIKKKNPNSHDFTSHIITFFLTRAIGLSCRHKKNVKGSVHLLPRHERTQSMDA